MLAAIVALGIALYFQFKNNFKKDNLISKNFNMRNAFLSLQNPIKKRKKPSF